VANCGDVAIGLRKKEYVNGMSDMNALVAEYRRIKKKHLGAMEERAARAATSSSVIRVYRPGTKEKLMLALEGVDIESLKKLSGQNAYKKWFEKELNRIADVIRKTNANNENIFPGYKWGHATKILCIYVRSLVLCSRYFSDAQKRHISPWLYAPIDRIVIKRLRLLGVPPPFKAIKEIDTPKKFYDVQNMLGNAAAQADVPRVWFDDAWTERL
jgi:hypothetical protein